MVSGLSALFHSAMESAMGALAGRFVDDCLTLTHAYAQLGIAAQVRAALVRIPHTRTGDSDVYGSVIPRWKDGLLHGHLMDVTAE